MKDLQFNLLSDLFGKDLTGWQICRCYFLEIDHHLMGTFPVITNDEFKKVVVTISKKDLEVLWSNIEPRRAKISSFIAVINLEIGVGFNLENTDKEETQSFLVLSKEGVVKFFAEGGSVCWAPGIYGTCDNIIKPDFDS